MKVGEGGHWGDAYCVALRGDDVVGVAGIERYDDAGLLRSVAVDESLRGSGVGGMLVENRLQWAEENGITKLYLLTDTAAQWFPRYGFVSHVGYITPQHDEAVRAFGPSDLHRRSFQAACYGDVEAVEAA